MHFNDVYPYLKEHKIIIAETFRTVTHTAMCAKSAASQLDDTHKFFSYINSFRVGMKNAI